MAVPLARQPALLLLVLPTSEHNMPCAAMQCNTPPVLLVAVTTSESE